MYVKVRYSNNATRTTEIVLRYETYCNLNRNACTALFKDVPNFSDSKLETSKPFESWFGAFDFKF